MKEDITPALIENVNKAFEENYNNNQRIARLLERGEKANYTDAYRYAEQVGTARAKAFKSQISSEVLPDGKMYFNIADRLMNETLSADHAMISEYAQNVQANVNKKSNLNLKAQKAELDEDRIEGFVNRLSSEDDYDSVSWILDEPVKTFARSVVDDTVKKNAEFQDRAGITATIIRTAEFKCCPWCADLAGDYTYPAPGEVFQRHDNCRCTLDYEGKRLQAYAVLDDSSVWGVRDTHTFRDLDKVEERKMFVETKMSQIRRKR